MECEICKEVFQLLDRTRQPLLLSCGHNFCLSCVSQLFQIESKSIECAICQIVSQYSNLEEIETNWSILQKLESHLSENESSICDLCENSRHSATMRCLDCRQTMCEIVAKIHLKSNFTKNHSIVPLPISTNSLPSLNHRYILHSRMCSIHFRPFDFYDEEAGCGKMICSYCVSEDHFGHKIFPLDHPTLIERKIESMHDLSLGIEERVRKLREAEEGVGIWMLELEASRDSVLKEIKESFDRLREKLNDRELSLKKQALDIYKSKRFRMEEKKGGMEVWGGQLKWLCECWEEVEGQMNEMMIMIQEMKMKQGIGLKRNHQGEKGQRESVRGGGGGGGGGGGCEVDEIAGGGGGGVMANEGSRLRTKESPDFARITFPQFSPSPSPSPSPMLDSKHHHLMVELCTLEASLRRSLLMTDPKSLLFAKESSEMCLKGIGGGGGGGGRGGGGRGGRPWEAVKWKEWIQRIECLGSIENEPPIPSFASGCVRSTRIISLEGDENDEDSGINHFDSPSDITAMDGLLYVADSGNNRIQVLRADGSFVRSFGHNGPGEGQLTDPLGIATYQGLVYVLDNSNDPIQVFGNDGRFVMKFGTTGDQNGQFNTPLGLLFHSDLLYISDSENHRIQVLRPDGTFVRKFGMKGKYPGQLQNPDGLVMIEDLLYISESNNHRISVFRPNGSFVKVFGTEGVGEGQLLNPTFLATDGKSGGLLLFVSEFGNNRISVFNKDGSYLTQIGSKGVGPNELLEPSGMVMVEGELYVVEKSNNRIQVFTEV